LPPADSISTIVSDDMTRDLRLGALAGLATLLPGMVLVLLGVADAIAIIVSVASGAGVIAALGRRWHRQASAAHDAQTVHLRSVIGVAATFPRKPLYWNDHAITPEALTVVLQLIAGLGVRQVLELGSGQSTLAIARTLQQLGGGRVLSFDDDARWAAVTAAGLKQEGLDDIAEVRAVPLAEIAAGGRHAPWYDLSGADRQARYDLILVDGPPAWKGDPLARLPALYELKNQLSDKGVLLLDDAARPGESEIARQWQRDCPDLHFRKVGIGRGLLAVSVTPAALDMLPA
jgi:predicted O-methyltransferase YrrM